KEYDLAWILRERLVFTNTIEEREAMLTGYKKANNYCVDTLRWCEVLNYVHWIHWCYESEWSDKDEYISFSLNKINKLIT
ncbi:MAG: hypothetical protein KAS62_05190, partial [Candidatus Delongbacteria bacterium]|nr:hypothetical protein [Candidatus Delongbacteria bacterium]